MEYYDRDGRPIDLWGWVKLSKDREYKVIGNTQVGPYVVSTVWLGLDHNFGIGPPIIFETMVFTASAWSDENRKLPFGDPEREPLMEIDCHRYSTEAAAVQGHHEMVELIRATTIEDPNEEQVSDARRPPGSSGATSGSQPGDDRPD